MISKRYFTYIISEVGEDRLCKIGHARDLSARLRELNCGNPRKLCVIYAEEHASKNAAEKHERSVHKLLKNHRISGEWFCCHIAIAAFNMFSIHHPDMVDMTNIEEEISGWHEVLKKTPLPILLSIGTEKD